MTDRWYALRTKPRKEDVVYKQLIGREIRVYYPRIRVHPVNPRSKKIKPYFPGYLFVNTNLDDIGISAYKWMPYTFGLVNFGGEPAVVPENLIFELRKRIQEISDKGGILFDELESGDKVIIKSGPFKGYQAIFDTRISGKDRVKVLLQMLSDQRQMPMEIDAGQIEKKT